MKKKLLGLLLAGVVLTVIDCSRNRNSVPFNPDAPGAGADAPTFQNVYSSILAAACAQCHNAGSAPPGTQLDFSDATTAYKTLLGSTANGLSTAGHCASVNIVTPGDPSNSYLAAVLIGADNHADFGQPGCTPYAVHLQDQNLSADEASALVGWIQAGAPNN